MQTCTHSYLYDVSVQNLHNHTRATCPAHMGTSSQRHGRHRSRYTPRRAVLLLCERERESESHHVRGRDGHLMPDCNATVAYAFFTRDRLPLWSTWERYFATCPMGSAVPIVHMQDVSHSGRLTMMRALEPYGGAIVPVSDTVLGSPRFSWRMVALMLRSFSLASRTTARNGCKPRWVHSLSERDAPVQDCATTHAFLASTHGESHMALPSDEAMLDCGAWAWGRQPRTQSVFPPLYRPFSRTSQWITLWMDHAVALVRA